MTGIYPGAPLKRVGGIMTVGGMFGCAVMMILMLASVIVTRSDTTPPLIAGIAVAVLSLPVAGCATMAEGAAREATTGSAKMAARTLAAALAAVTVALLDMAARVV